MKNIPSVNILFLLSSLEPAGSETYCVALEKAWEGRHGVFWISDRLHYGQTYAPLPIHEKAFPGGVTNTIQVARFVRRNEIQIIHSHSRRARWVAAQVSTLTKVPHVATIHQPQPVHLFSRLFPCLGDHTIAIDEAVASHLQTHFPRSLKQVSLIRNGIDLERYSIKTPPPLWGRTEVGGASLDFDDTPHPAPSPTRGEGNEENRVLYIGRLTGGRRRALQFFFSVLKRSVSTLPPTRFQIIGRIPDEYAPELNRRIDDVNRVIRPSSLQTLGFVADPIPLIQDCRGVIAGGRSALEAMACGKPVIALGEQGVVGLCSSDTLEEALRTNFGDHFDTKDNHFYPAKMEWALRQLLGRETNLPELGHWGRMQVEKHYNIETVSAGIEKICQSLCP